MTKWVIALAWLAACAAQAADPAPRALPAAGIGMPDISEGGNAAPADAEAQLREIERTKRLMRALGEIQQPAAPAPLRAAGAIPPVAAPGAGGMPVTGGDASRNMLPSVQLQLPVAEIREVASAVSEAARAVGVNAERPKSEMNSRTLPAIDEPRAGTRPGSQEETRKLVDGLMDEVLPWALAFVVFFSVAYGAYSWLSARSPRHSRHGEAHRARSRRHRDAPEDPGVRRRSSSSRSSRSSRSSSGR